MVLKSPVPADNQPSPIIAPEGRPIVILFAVIAAILGFAAVKWLGPAGWAVVAVGAILTIWCLWFFRDPDRVIPTEADGVVSPADGVICHVGNGSPPADLQLSAPETEGMVKISVFMNVFNVHVNRAPVSGVIARIAYHAGQFLNASFDKASELNERSAMAIRMGDGRIVVAVQIAGLVARRIVSRVKEGRSLAKGERYGLIRFGSRVDVYLPAGSVASVKLGEKVVAGETILGRLGPVVGEAGAGAASPSFATAGA